MANMTNNKDMEDRMRRSNIIRDPEQMNGREVIFKEIIAENYPKLIEVMNMRILEAKHTTSRIKERKQREGRRERKVQLGLP